MRQLRSKTPQRGQENFYPIAGADRQHGVAPFMLGANSPSPSLLRSVRSDRNIALSLFFWRITRIGILPNLEKFSVGLRRAHFVSGCALGSRQPEQRFGPSGSALQRGGKSIPRLRRLVRH